MGESFFSAICHTSRCSSRRSSVDFPLQKIHLSALLSVLEDRYTGVVIGSICVPHIMVADDTPLITNSEDELQVVVEDTGESANQEQYVIY